MSNYMSGLFVIFGALLIGLMVMMIIITWMRSHRLRVRDPTRGNSYINDYWVMEKKDKETGCLYWVNVWFQPKLKTERPPSSAIDVGKRGRLFAECYLLNAGNENGVVDVCWIKDQEITDKTMISVTGKTLVNSFEPLSITSKSFGLSEFKKAQEKRAHKWDIQKVVSMATLGVFGLMIVMLLIFAPDIFKEMKGYRAQNLAIMEQSAEITANQALIMQSISSKLGNLNVQIVQTPPDAEGGTITQPGEDPPEN